MAKYKKTVKKKAKRSVSKRNGLLTGRVPKKSVPLSVRQQADMRILREYLAAKKIAEAYLEITGFTKEFLTRKSRKQAIVYARQEFCYILAFKFRVKPLRLVEYLDKDHTTIHNALFRAIEAEEVYASFRNSVEDKYQKMLEILTKP